MSITLLELRTQARDRADMKNSQFVSDSELNSYINASIAELHDVLVQSYGSDYFVNSYNFTTVAGTDRYALPVDLYKIMGVDANLNGGEYVALKKFNFNERTRFTTHSVWSIMGVPEIRYRLVGSNIVFSPIPDSAVPIKLWYVPVATKLTLNTDSFNDLNQYAEYVIVDAAMKMMQKEESDVSVLMAQKQLLTKRIEEASQNRDAGEPESVSDIYAEDQDYFFRR